MKNNYLVINTSTDPFYNLALEEYLLTNYTEGTIVMLWQNENTIVIGRHQNALEEVNQQYVDEHKIKVVRRNTGGGAVYHDLGNLNYSVITDQLDTNENMMRIFSEPVIAVLKDLGVEATFSGRNDILIDGKKVSGTAQKIYKTRVLHHGCILFDTDLDKVSESLNVRPEKFQSKAIKSVRSRVGNIKDYLQIPVSMQEFRDRISEKLIKESPYLILNISENEQEEVQRLSKEKYETWEWTYGHPIECTVHNYKRYEGGTVEVYMSVEDGIIEKCQMYGDFMAARPASEVGKALEGCRYEYKYVLNLLNCFNMEEYFGTISAAEVALCICCAKE